MLKDKDKEQEAFRQLYGSQGAALQDCYYIDTVDNVVLWAGRKGTNTSYLPGVSNFKTENLKGPVGASYIVIQGPHKNCKTGRT